MMKSLIVFLGLFCLLSKTCVAQSIPVIPLPVQVIPKSSTCAIASNRISFKCNEHKFLQKIEEFGFPMHKKGLGIPAKINITSSKSEAYELNILCRDISITGSEKGVYNALQTLHQLYENYNGNIPCMMIIDSPRFAYRGMHLDVSRHFFSVDEVKKYINYLSKYKFNKFHWHLTDDQGWRIEIKKYPLLKKIGGSRSGTFIGKQTDALGAGKYDKTIEEGFYTQDEIKDIVAYAASKYIDVIPEIEMPGHSLAAVAAYPWLSCANKTVQVGQRWGVFDEVYCAGNDSVFNFIENVLEEVMVLFPSKYIHIGGDEVEKTSWKECAKCQSKIKKENLKDEHELQSYFVQRIEKYLNKNNRSLIGWDEILEGGLSPNATLMSWRGEDGGIAAAKLNHDVIMTPGKPLYFDHSQNKYQDEPLNIGGNNSYTQVYNYNPLPSLLPTDKFTFILGAQANVWTEYITDFRQVEYMIFPRMQALSEALWSDFKQKKIQDFQLRLGKDLAKFDQRNINFRMPEPIGFKDSMTRFEFSKAKFESRLANYEIVQNAGENKYIQYLDLQLIGDSKKAVKKRFKIIIRR
jgi:hexosaminidase